MISTFNSLVIDEIEHIIIIFIGNLKIPWYQLPIQVVWTVFYFCFLFFVDLVGVCVWSGAGVVLDTSSCEIYVL